MGNKITHSDRFFRKDSEKGQFQDLIRFVKNRTDIAINEKSKDEFTHRIIVLNSSLQKDYIRLITEVFSLLINAARRLRYIE